MSKVFIAGGRCVRPNHQRTINPEKGQLGARQRHQNVAAIANAAVIKPCGEVDVLTNRKTKAVGRGWELKSGWALDLLLAL